MIPNDVGSVRSIDKDRVTRAHRLGPALAGLRKEVTGTAGRLAYYVAGNGPPLLLVHSVNAAASAYEVRPIYDGMQATHRVYALDLPGFGQSDRSGRDYAVPLYVAAIHDMLRIIAAEAGVTVIDALALSPGSEFLARAATQAPSRFRTLTLVTPTGFAHGAAKREAPAGATREVPGLLRLLQFPLWSQALFNLLVSRASIRYFLRRASRRNEAELANPVIPHRRDAALRTPGRILRRPDALPGLGQSLRPARSDAMSSACSSSTASIPSRILRVVESRLPIQRMISR